MLANREIVLYMIFTIWKVVHKMENVFNHSNGVKEPKFPLDDIILNSILEWSIFDFGNFEHVSICNTFNLLT